MMRYLSARPHRIPRGRPLLCVWAAAVSLALVPVAPAGADAPPSPSASAATPTALPRISPSKSAGSDCVGGGSDIVAETPWTHNTLGLAEVHRLNQGRDATVAVLATAVDGGTPALDGAVEGGGSDCLGFGTFLAGVVAARPVPGSGFVGVVPQAEVVAVATGAPRTGLTTADDLADAIGSAASSDADVVLVGTAAWEGSERLDEAVSAAEEAGALVVAPATASGPDGVLPGHPAQHPSVLSVAAHRTDGAPVLDAPVPLPDDEDGFARVDLLAPGDRVMSVGPGGDGHFVSGGDGVAAAFVAGAAALVRSAEPDLTPAQVRERLLATAYPFPRGADDPLTGHGRVDPLAAAVSGPGGPANTVPGEGFVPDPSPRGSVDAVATATVVGGCGFVIVLCVLGGAVARRGRARRWRPAAPGEPVTPDGP